MDHEQYRHHAKIRFSGIGTLEHGDLSELLALHEKEIEFLREERKMHFGALALVGILIFLLLPLANVDGPMQIPALVLLGLLLLLELPYIFVYFRFENTLQRMNREYFTIRDALGRKAG